MLEFVGKGVSLLFIQFNRVSERVHNTDHHDALIIPNLYELVLAPAFMNNRIQRVAYPGNFRIGTPRIAVRNSDETGQCSELIRGERQQQLPGVVKNLVHGIDSR